MDEARVAKRVGPWWLPYLSTPVGFLGFWALHRLGVLGPTPLWVLLLLTGITAGTGLVVEVATRHLTHPKVRLHVRLGSATLRFAVQPDEGGHALVVQLIGLAKAMDFFMRKRILSATERARAAKRAAGR